MAEFDLLGYMNVELHPPTPKSKPSLFPASKSERRAPVSGRREPIILTPSRSPLQERVDMMKSGEYSNPPAPQEQDSCCGDDVNESASVRDYGSDAGAPLQVGQPQFEEDEEDVPRNVPEAASPRGSCLSARRSSVASDVLSTDSVVDKDEICDTCVNKHLAAAKWAKAQREKDRDAHLHQEFEERYQKQREEARKLAEERKKELGDFVRKSKEEREAELARRKELEEQERQMDRELVEAARARAAAENAEAKRQKQQDLLDGLQQQLQDKKSKEEMEKEREAQEQFPGLLSPSRNTVDPAQAKDDFRRQLVQQIEDNKRLKEAQAQREAEMDNALAQANRNEQEQRQVAAEARKQAQEQEKRDYESALAAKRAKNAEQARKDKEWLDEENRRTDEARQAAREGTAQERARKQAELIQSLKEQQKERADKMAKEKAYDSKPWLGSPLGGLTPAAKDLIDCAECGTKFSPKRLLGSPSRAALDSWKKYLSRPNPATPSKLARGTEYADSYN